MSKPDFTQFTPDLKIRAFDFLQVEDPSLASEYLERARKEKRKEDEDREIHQERVEDSQRQYQKSSGASSSTGWNRPTPKPNSEKTSSQPQSTSDKSKTKRPQETEFEKAQRKKEIEKEIQQLKKEVWREIEKERREKKMKEEEFWFVDVDGSDERRCMEVMRHWEEMRDPGKRERREVREKAEKEAREKEETEETEGLEGRWREMKLRRDGQNDKEEWEDGDEKAPPRYEEKEHLEYMMEGFPEDDHARRSSWWSWSGLSGQQG